MTEHTKIKNENNEIIKAGCVVVNENNEVLLINRPRDWDVWSFPKGHAEHGETIEQVALREVREETGYEVKLECRLSDLNYSNSKTGELIRLYMFKAKPLSKSLEVTENTKSKWFIIEEAKKIIYPNLAFILEELE